MYDLQIFFFLKKMGKFKTKNLSVKNLSLLPEHAEHFNNPKNLFQLLWTGCYGSRDANKESIYLRAHKSHLKRQRLVDEILHVFPHTVMDMFVTVKPGHRRWEDSWRTHVSAVVILLKSVSVARVRCLKPTFICTQLTARFSTSHVQLNLNVH